MTTIVCIALCMVLGTVQHRVEQEKNMPESVRRPWYKDPVWWGGAALVLVLSGLGLALEYSARLHGTSIVN